MPQNFRAQTQHARRVARIAFCAIAVDALAALTGCGDEGSERVARDEKSVASAPAGETAWLGLTDDALPEEWLVRRKVKAGADIDPAAIVAARALLGEASKRFGDQPRMIANRAAQLEQMLTDKGYGEDAMVLIETLMRVAPGSKPTGGFSSICQYYFNLRAQGLDREQALEALAKRYGPSA